MEYYKILHYNPNIITKKRRNDAAFSFARMRAGASQGFPKPTRGRARARVSFGKVSVYYLT